MKDKIFVFIFLSIFLISLISAETMIVDAWFENDIYKTSAEINLGKVINFDAVFSSTGSPSTENILVDSSLTIVEISCNQISSHTKNCTYQATPTKVGTFKITVTGTDNSGDSDEAELTLTVTSSSSNNAPVLDSIGNKVINENELLEFTISAKDSDIGDTLSFSAPYLPTGATLNQNSGQFSWIPTFSQSGTYSITFSVSDGKGGTDSETITITVNDVTTSDTTAPTITLNGDSSITLELGEEYTELGATATDDRDGNLTSEIIISSNVNTSVLGTYQVNYTVSDSAGNSVNATRTIIIEDTTAPLIEIVTPVNKTYSNDEIEVQVRITELDLQNCWYELNGNERTFACENGINNFEIDAESGENELIIYANDSSGNENSTSITFEYKKKSKSHSGGGGSSTTKVVDSESTNKESSGNFAIPSTTSNVKGNSYKELNFLYYLIISTASLGIILVSLILYRKLKPVKKPVKQNYTPTQNQNSPYY
jgi:hypothetical protein